MKSVTLTNLLLGFLSLTLTSGLLAQPTQQVEDLTKDINFFRQQKELYQQWLDESGLGVALKVYDVEAKPQELALYLAFHTENVDTVNAVWKNLKSAFEREQPLTLEQQLFYKMTHMMEVRQSIANVQIYDTYDLRVEPLFFRGIYFEEGKVMVDSSGHKSQDRKVDISPADLSNMKDLSREEFNKKFSKQAVFNQIQQYVQKRYERATFEGGEAKIILLENENLLRFEVEDLRREVLTDAANPTLCEILRKFGYDCNWVKRERLTFTFAYEETLNGFRIALNIDGKYGSGFYRSVGRGGYIDMEIDFKDYLIRYADQFAVGLKNAFLSR